MCYMLYTTALHLQQARPLTAARDGAAVRSTEPIWNLLNLCRYLTYRMGIVMFSKFKLATARVAVIQPEPLGSVYQRRLAVLPWFCSKKAISSDQIKHGYISYVYSKLGSLWHNIEIDDFEINFQKKLYIWLGKLYHVVDFGF